MSEPRVAGVVLAAGASSRLGGGRKVLLPYGDSTILGTVLALAASAGLDPLVIVLGHGVGPVLATLPDTGGPAIVPVLNPTPEAGIGSSVIAGLRELIDGDADAAAVLLGDEPDIEVGAIRQVVREWQRSNADVARAIYRDRPGHPVVLARWTFARLAEGLGMKQSQARGVLPALERAGYDITPVNLSLSGPADVDTPADYARAVTQLWRAKSESAGTSPAAVEPRGSRHP